MWWGGIDSVVGRGSGRSQRRAVRRWVVRRAKCCRRCIWSLKGTSSWGDAGRDGRPVSARGLDCCSAPWTTTGRYDGSRWGVVRLGRLLRRVFGGIHLEVA